MTRKLGIVGAVVVLSALGFGLGAASAKSGIASPITLTVFEHSTTDKVIDVGKQGDSTGDILTFHNNVYDAADTTKVGLIQGQCVRVNPRAGTWECWGNHVPDRWPDHRRGSVLRHERHGLRRDGRHRQL